LPERFRIDSIGLKEADRSYYHFGREQFAGLFTLAVLVLGFLSISGCTKEVAPPGVEFENKTQEVGLTKYTPSFAVVVADIDGDAVDDLFIGRHGFPPDLYLNKNGKFIEAQSALPPALRERADRHGYTFVDFDNDGDKDFAIAGGGAEGIGAGQPNQIYKNLLIETNNLEFIDVTDDSDISNPTGRTRHFFPIANGKGDKVDLYGTALHQRREGSKNLYAVNNSTPSKIRFNSDENSSLHQEFQSDGKDLFFDFDRDGLVDFLRIGQGRAQLYKNSSGEFIPFPGWPSNVWGVVSGVSADLNNDGFPDLYLGGGRGPNNSDYLVNNAQEIHFSVERQAEDQVDGFSFRANSSDIKINFEDHLFGFNKLRTDPADIFLGASKKHPRHRIAEISRDIATGKPVNMESSGVYIWYEPEEDLWHIFWKYDQESTTALKGIIYAADIELTEKIDLESIPAKVAKDSILINQRGMGWRFLDLEELNHYEFTESLTAADFNNDGFVDIVGLRAGDVSQENGNPFILLNHGDMEFSGQDILENEEDDIFRADIIVHGFFNEDGLPDIFFTNGSGLIPSHVGPYQFWLNSTHNAGGYLVLELEGTTANRDAIGAQIELYDMEENLLGYRELGSNFGRGQNTHKIHFGLGHRKGPFKLKIRWPGGDKPQQLMVNRNSYYHIQQN
jgi:hypothetical protein